MIAVRHMAGKRAMVFGLGKSGLACAMALEAGGCEVIGYDDNPAVCNEAAAKGITIEHPGALDWSRIFCLVLSPGIPLTYPKPHYSVELANNACVEVIGDVELYLREKQFDPKRCCMIGVSGTNGKSTTASLIAHILDNAGYPCALGGNIGLPVLELPGFVEGRIDVIECSSYQIALSPSFSADIGILLNIANDHLEHHGTFTNYRRIKRRIVANARQWGVIALDDQHTRQIAKDLKATHTNIVTVSTDDGQGADFFCKDGQILRSNGLGQAIAQIGKTRALRGEHNHQNALAGVIGCLKLGLKHTDLQAGLDTFSGLPHRMEEVARLGNIIFINDSKATNVDACGKALACFDNIHWIAGGRYKNDNIKRLSKYFHAISQAYLIGEAQREFAAALSGQVANVCCHTLSRAVNDATNCAIASSKPSVVLFSPACASFDQFANFEQRGELFRDEVLRIIDPARRIGG